MILELAVILGYYLVKNIPKSVARIGRSTSSVAGNIKPSNKNLGTQATIAVFKITENLAFAKCKKPGPKEEVNYAFNRNAMILYAPRFGLPGHFEATGDLCARKMRLGQDPISRF
jgi:hypothetical protein